MRNGGETITCEMFKTLIAHPPPPNECSLLNDKYTRQAKERGIKIVFAFDEAEKLTEIAQNTVVLSNGSKEGSLFHATYKVIHLFNNPVYLGTTYSLSKTLMGISEHGRTFVESIIGDYQPWYTEDVETMLLHKFNLGDWKTSNEKLFNALCYMLSGSPENLVRFHRHMLSPWGGLTLSEKIKDSYDLVVKWKEEAASKYLQRYLKEDSFLVDRKNLLLQLLYGAEVPYTITSMEYDNKLQGALIEYSIAHVVKKENNTTRVFEIVDPLYYATFFKACFKNHLIDMLKFIKNQLTQKQRPRLGDGWVWLLISGSLHDSCHYFNNYRTELSHMVSI